LMGAENFDKIWSAGWQHETKHAKWEINKHMYSYMYKVVQIWPGLICV
jgi:hypothetical protein